MAVYEPIERGRGDARVLRQTRLGFEGIARGVSHHRPNAVTGDGRGFHLQLGGAKPGGRNGN